MSLRDNRTYFQINCSERFPSPDHYRIVSVIPDYYASTRVCQRIDEFRSISENFPASSLFRYVFRRNIRPDTAESGYRRTIRSRDRLVFLFRPNAKYFAARFLYNSLRLRVRWSTSTIPDNKHVSVTETNVFVYPRRNAYSPTLFYWFAETPANLVSSSEERRSRTFTRQPNRYDF